MSLQLVFDALALGGIYAVAALGIALIFGVMRLGGGVLCDGLLFGRLLFGFQLGEGVWVPGVPRVQA